MSLPVILFLLLVNIILMATNILLFAANHHLKHDLFQREKWHDRELQKLRSRL